MSAFLEFSLFCFSSVASGLILILR
jgi:hypothetical protein